MCLSRICLIIISVCHHLLVSYSMAVNTHTLPYSMAVNTLPYSMAVNTHTLIVWL